MNRLIHREISRDIHRSTAWIASGGVSALPSGAIGAWYADKYESAPREYIPNAVSTVAVSQNLLQLPRRRFGNTEFFGKTECAVTDRATNAPDGTNDASRVVGNAADWYLFPTPHVVFTAGTYTVGITARVHGGGADQSFRMGIDGTLETKTVTAVYQRFSTTVTIGAGSKTTWLVRGPGTTAGDLDIIDAGLYAGSVDLGEPALAGHLILGRNYNNSPATCASGALDLSNGGFGLIQFPNNLALTEYTLVALVRKKTNAKTLNPIMNELAGYSNFAQFVENANTMQTYFNGVNRVGANAISGTWKLYNRGWKTITHRISDSTASVFINGAMPVSKSYSPTAITLRDIIVGVFDTPASGTTDLEIASMVLWPRALTDAEVKTSEAVLTARASVYSIAVTDDDVIWMAEGDSITIDTNAYVKKFGANATINVIGGTRAVIGDVVANLVSRAASVDSCIPETTGGKKFVLSILVGANDLTGATTTTTFLTNLAAYCDARRAAGWTVILCTILPNTNSGFNAKRNVANTEIRLWTTGGSTIPGIHADYICDFAADATMGPDAAASDNSLYGDGIHPTNLGHTYLEAVIRPVLNGI